MIKNDILIIQTQTNLILSLCHLRVIPIGRKRELSAKFAACFGAAIIDQHRRALPHFVCQSQAAPEAEKAEVVPGETIKDNWPYQFIKTINLFKLRQC